ncbi:MAG: heme-binding protein [Candidatus Hydrogenedentes bacterium]|nr:heme-binding protein [Candidatus Hydrogenedentota bacterium]
MSRRSVLGLLVLPAVTIVLLGVWIAIGWWSVAGVAEPSYEVISRHDGYEIRQYGPQLVAEVEVEGAFTEATNRGFRQLADYIFGNNVVPNGEGAESSAGIAMTAPVIEREAVSEEIAMTAPVLERDASAGLRIITFVMPASYTLETLPKPRNEAVRIVEVPARRCAVHAFSGSVGGEKAAARKERLLALLERDGLGHVGQPMLAQFDPPWTPPFMRRNEVWVELAAGE